MAETGWNPALLRSIISQFPQPKTARASLAEFRRLGGKMRTQTWERLWAQVQNERALAGIEERADLRTAPTPNEMLARTTPRASGIEHAVTVFARTQSGNVIAKTITVKSTAPMQRWRAIRRAEEIATGIESSTQANPDTSIVTVLGGVYSGTYYLQKEH